MIRAQSASSAGGSTPSEKPGDARIGPQTPPMPTQPLSAAAAVQAERKRIAQALHDTVSQTLTGTYLQALVIARKLEANSPEAAKEVMRLTETIHRAAVELQEVARGLQPEGAKAMESGVSGS